MRLRPRNAWEGLDLGFALARRSARSIYAAWFAVYLPVAAVAFLALRNQPFWAWALLWWLKPLFDRVVLEVLASDLFEDRPRLATILRRVPSLLWRSGIVGALTWRRFDPARSLHLPVYQLERLSGREARRRISVLDRDARPAGLWLSFMLLFVDLLYGLGLSLAIALLAPVQTPLDTLVEGWFHAFESGGPMLRGALLFALSMSFVEPLYVACGFTLYLQRRTALEGWDIELRFRQLAARASAPSRAVTAAAAVAFALAMGLATMPPPAFAADASNASREIRSVLAQPEFGHEEKVSRIKYVGPRWEPKESDSKPLNLRWLTEWLEVMARALRGLAWVAGIFIAAFILYHVAKQVRLRSQARSRLARPDFLFGLDVRPESLPDDVSAAADALLRKGALREALSLLYRASLVRFMDEGVEFRLSDTEGDCLRRLGRGIAPQRRAYFERLVAAWRLLAYAHRAIDAAEALSLAQEWRRHFASAAQEKPPAGGQPQAA